MTANELVAKVKNLPPVSHAALRLVSLLDQPAISNEEVVQTLKCDNVLTAKLLRACNSPFFGFEDSVASVDQAVLMLGHQQILHIVLTLAFAGAMSVPLPGYAAEANSLWRHSLTTATAAELIAHSGAEISLDPSVAFTIGLLHDIGKLVISQAMTPDFQLLVQERIQARGESRVQAEQAILGTDHAAAGASLLRAWRLPSEIVEAVANHHQPLLDPHPHLSAVAHLADCAAHQAITPPENSGLVPQADSLVLEALEISPEGVERLVGEINESSTKVQQLMTMA